MHRFIPLGQLVSMVAIYLFSLIFLRTVSSLNHHHCVVPGVAVGGNWLLCLCLMYVRWLFILSFSACSVLPTYWQPHILHWMRYMRLAVLQMTKLHVVAVANSLAGKCVCGHQCWAGFASRSSTWLIPRGRMGQCLPG